MASESLAGVVHGMAVDGPGVDAVPEDHARLAQLPAEQNLPAIATAGEIDQSGLEVLQVAADAAQLLEQLVDSFDNDRCLCSRWSSLY